MLYVGILLGIVVLLLLVALVKTLLTPTLKSTYVADEPEEVSLPLSSFPWFTRSWRSRTSTGICCIIGRARAGKSPSCS